jgi:hypothetical protein
MACSFRTPHCRADGAGCESCASSPASCSYRKPDSLKLQAFGPRHITGAANAVKADYGVALTATPVDKGLPISGVSSTAPLPTSTRATFIRGRDYFHRARGAQPPPKPLDARSNSQKGAGSSAAQSPVGSTDAAFPRSRPAAWQAGGHGGAVLALLPRRAHRLLALPRQSLR